METMTTEALDPATADLARRLQDALHHRAGHSIDDPTAVQIALDLDGYYPHREQT